jgi:hypothetical protein
VKSQTKEDLKNDLFWFVALTGPAGVFSVIFGIMMLVSTPFELMETEQTRYAREVLAQARAGDILVMENDVYLEVLEERAPGHLVVDELGYGNNREHLHTWMFYVRRRFVSLVKADDPNNSSIRILHERRV